MSIHYENVISLLLCTRFDDFQWNATMHTVKWTQTYTVWMGRLVGWASHRDWTQNQSFYATFSLSHCGFSFWNLHARLTLRVITNKYAYFSVYVVVVSVCVCVYVPKVEINLWLYMNFKIFTYVFLVFLQFNNKNWENFCYCCSK